MFKIFKYERIFSNHGSDASPLPYNENADDVLDINLTLYLHHKSNTTDYNEITDLYSDTDSLYVIPKLEFVSGYSGEIITDTISNCLVTIRDTDYPTGTATYVFGHDEYGVTELYNTMGTGSESKSINLNKSFDNLFKLDGFEISVCINLNDGTESISVATFNSENGFKNNTIIKCYDAYFPSETNMSIINNYNNTYEISFNNLERCSFDENLYNFDCTPTVMLNYNLGNSTAFNQSIDISDSNYSFSEDSESIEINDICLELIDADSFRMYRAVNDTEIPLLNDTYQLPDNGHLIGDAYIDIVYGDSIRYKSKAIEINNYYYAKLGAPLNIRYSKYPTLTNINLNSAITFYWDNSNDLSYATSRQKYIMTFTNKISGKSKSIDIDPLSTLYVIDRRQLINKLGSEILSIEPSNLDNNGNIAIEIKLSSIPISNHDSIELTQNFSHEPITFNIFIQPIKFTSTFVRLLNTDNFTEGQAHVRNFKNLTENTKFIESISTFIKKPDDFNWKEST